jgi:Ca2+-binding RTX toxin-like protein
MARIEVTAENFPGKAHTGLGTDTLVLVGGGTFDFAYATLSGFSAIAIESGAGKYATIRISGEQLTGITSFSSTDSYTSLSLTGSNIDLSGKSVSNINSLSIADDNATVIVSSLALALKLNALEHQGETIVLNGLVSTPASRSDLHNRGFDRIIEGSNTWTNAAPTLTGLSGHFHVREGESVRIDPEGDALISDLEGPIAYLDIDLSGNGMFFVMSNFKLGANFRILDNFSDQILLYKDSVVGTINRKFGGDGASIAFNQSATAQMINEFVQNLSYAPGDFIYEENVVVTVTVRDKGYRKAEAVFYVTAENNWTPTKPTLTGGSVVENSAAGTVVGTIKATDANGDRISYRLTDDAGGRFRIENDKLVVSGNAPIDFEQATKYTVTMVANDGEQDGLPATFVISVINVPNSKISGTKGKDTLTGTAERDFLYGGLGNDTLTGGGDKDFFVFNAKLGTAETDRKVNFDKITDFDVAADSIWLDDKIFNNTALKLLGKTASEASPKKLNKKFFTVAEKAKDKDDYIVYNKKTGVISYDPDGAGSKAAIDFAQVKQGLSLKYENFFVI